jgi:protein-arginine kinase activator protein McsA
MPKRLTTREFVEKARAAHGDRYDYSEVEYVNAITKVKIICPDHGGFWQIANTHARGSGCYDCGRKASSSSQILGVDLFISKAMLVHGDKYDYSEVEYKTGRKKVKIICPKHGAFWQTPNSHMRGVGCADCGGTKKLNTNLFISNARIVHGDKYDYSEVEYRKAREKVKIICPEHGAFWQTPNTHARGRGCYDCGQKAAKSLRILGIDSFISKAMLVHGDKYDYSEVEYKTGKKKVKIICPKHGAFWQTPDSHMRGVGCPCCGREIAGWTKTNWTKAAKKSNNFYGYKLYLIVCKNENESFFKVGRTFQKVNQRFKRSIFPYNYRTVSKIIGPGETIYNLEIEFFRAGFKRYAPQISFAGETECFHISELKKAKRWFDRNRKGVLKSAQLQLFPSSPPSFL